MTLYDITIPQFIKMLGNTKHIFEKAAHYADSKKIEASVLLESRLAPDQFPFTRQIQIMCDTAKFCASRLTGKDGPTFPDTEKDLTELKARVDATIDYLQSFSAKDFAESANKRITQARWEGQSLSGEEYVIHHVIPNFYFHLTTAYAILRNNGVDVGKKDYLGELPFKK
jgi:hypothetical protein